MARDRAGIHVRTALTAAIYRKVQELTLRLQDESLFLEGKQLK